MSREVGIYLNGHPVGGGETLDVRVRLAFLRDVDANLGIHESLGRCVGWGIGLTQGLS